MKKTYLLYLLGGLLTFSCQQTQNTANNSSNDASLDHKVDSVLALMNLDEKIGQLTMYNGSWDFTGPLPENNNEQAKLNKIKSGKVGGMLNVLTVEGTMRAQKMAVENSRLGIPLIFGYDVIHGYKTMFPVPLAQAASWDEELARKGSEIAAKEASASGLHWTFAPMMDISRDARWGRIMESGGEDPYLTSQMVKGWVKGFQGDDLASPHTIAACAKHFAAYGFAEAGRDYNTVDISTQTLFNTVLPPFKAASDAGVATFMNAFNDISGTPATGHKFLQRDVLKGDWGFKGFVVSDWASIGELMTHGFAEDSLAAAKLALEAGSDMDMEARIYEHHIKPLIESGKMDVAILDDAVRRILRIKFQLGLFDDPYRYADKKREASEVFTAETKQAARESARGTMVLLKNEGQLLPIKPSVKSIAIIGSLADSKDVPLGSWRAQAVTNSGVSLVEGIQQAVGDQVTVTYVPGYQLTTGRRTFINELTIVEGDQSGFGKAMLAAKQADLVIMAMGEDCFQSGEGRSQVDVGLKGDQEALLMALLKINPNNVVVVLMNGRPLAIPQVAEKAPAILETWFGGSEAGHAIADVLFGKYNPSGKLPVSFPRHTGQEPLYYNHKNTGRPSDENAPGLVFWSHYTDMPNSPLWPFGYGLSYTTFQYDQLQVTPKGKTAEVSIQLTNTGELEGTETVQVYIRDLHASITQPIKRLVDFKKVMLKKGEGQTVSFTLTEEDLGFYHADQRFYAESGKFQIFVGGSSATTNMKEVKLSF